MPSPFDLSDDSSYQNWREKKLTQALSYSKNINDLFVTIKNCQSPSKAVIDQVLQNCLQHSFSFYRLSHKSDNTKSRITHFVKQLGLKQLDANICADEDKLTSITQTTHKNQHDYIPYSNKRLSWHTDGYYNTTDKQINAMLLHCKQPAKSGGVSLIMDHEIAYILLRDENPDFIRALMEKDAMTIPANILNNKVIREAQTGPIFTTLDNGQLHMRYSARSRNIEWKQSPPILEAISFLTNLFESDSPYILKHTLQAGEGLICRNILHRRTSFVDYEESDKKRLLYRGRYFDTLNKP
jgi:hypothetical protein